MYTHSLTNPKLFTDPGGRRGIWTWDRLAPLKSLEPSSTWFSLSIDVSGQKASRLVQPLRRGCQLIDLENSHTNQSSHFLKKMFINGDSENWISQRKLKVRSIHLYVVWIRCTQVVSTMPVFAIVKGKFCIDFVCQALVEKLCWSPLIGLSKLNVSFLHLQGVV